MRLTAKDKIWLGLTGLLVAVQVFSCLALSRSLLLTAIGDFTQCLLLSSFVYLAATNASRGERRTRLFWTLMASGGGMWLWAQILWTYFEVILRQEVPNPFVGDVILFLHLVPMMGALAVKPHLEPDELTAQGGTMNLVLLLVWWLYLFLFAVIPWHYVAFDDRLYGENFDILYTVENAVFLVALALVWRSSRGGWRRIYALLFGASLVYALSGLTSNLAINTGKYYTGSIYDVPLVASMAAFGVVALCAGRRPVALEGAEQPASRGVWVTWFAMVARLSLPILVGWALYSSKSGDDVRHFRIILTLGTMLLMGALASMKQSRSDEQLARANQELREASLSDLLTGARNRRYLTSTIDADVQQVIRDYAVQNEPGRRNRDLIFYLIDADHFKEVNDRFGHDVGDQVLIEIARRISTAIRNSDVLIRWGGEEFLVVSRYTDRENAAALAARVLAAVGSDLFSLKGGESIRRTCSIGWSVFPWFVGSPEAVPYTEVLRMADSALYEAKKGRNQAFGMIPTSELPASSAETTPLEQLPAQTVVIQGPEITKTDLREAPAGAKATVVS